MKTIVRKISSLIVCLAMVASVLTVIPVTEASPSPKSMYLVPNHHTGQFDAWEIKHDGTVEYQTTYWLSYATDPAGIAIDESSNTLLITSEFSGGVEMVNATTMISLGVSTGPSNLAGIAVDDANDIVYAIRRWSDDLYVYDWDPSTKTLTVRAGYNPFNLPGCSGAFGLGLDEIRGILWVADSAAGIVRAYDIDTWTEDASQSFTPSHKAVDVAVDRMRNLVYTVSMSLGAGVPGGCGSNLLSRYDLSARTETTVDLGHQGVGVAVDELTGYVYVTGDYYARKLEAWDTSTTPWTQVQAVSVSGSPAGICVPQEEVAYNPLGLGKDDGLADGECISAGEDITYEICFDNTKNTYDVHSVKVVDELPGEVSFISATSGGTYDPSTHAVIWHIGTLSAGATQQCLQLMVHVCSTVSPRIKPVSAWIPTWGKPDLDDSLAMFKENTDLFEAASPYAYRFDGTITLETMYPYQEDSTLLKTIRDEGVMVIPALRDDCGINPGPYLADPEFREAYVSAIVSKVEAMGYDGIDVDFETMTKEDRPAFSNFMSELSASLHATGKLLTTAVMTKTVDFPGWGPVDAMDWALLGGVCNKVIIMFYNEEPASTDYVKRVIDYAISVMPKNRIVYAARFNPPGYMSASLLEEQLDIVLAKGIRREIYIWGVWEGDSSLWGVIREKLAPAPAPGSTIVNYATIDSDETLPTTISESTDVCPLLGEIGLLVDITPRPQSCNVSEIIEFEVSVTNPADVAGTDVTAYYVKLTVIEPEEIEIDVPAGGMDIAKILPGNTSSTTFDGKAIKAGDNVEVIVNAWGYTDLSDEVGKIRGRGSCIITIHKRDAPKPDWSFAIITDPHVGYNRPDYDGETWDDSGLGESYDITKYLENAVDKIITERGPYNIKFVVVLGDFADTAEKSEFLKAREILNRLNDPNGDGDASDGIPYIPVIGDHDQWPYIQKERPDGGVDPSANDRFESVKMKADHAYGDTVFKAIFWDTNLVNVGLLQGLDGLQDWTRAVSPCHITGTYNFFHTGIPPIWKKHEYDQDVYPQNYAFTYNGINFICLDFNPRMKEPGDDRGGFADCYDKPHGIYGETKSFLEKYLETHQNRTTIILSHHPLCECGGFTHQSDIAQIVYKHKCNSKTYNFAGHTHRNWPLPGDIGGYMVLARPGPIGFPVPAYEVIETEAVSQILFEWPWILEKVCGEYEETGKTIRIVQVEKSKLNYSTVLKPREVEVRWPFPDFAYKPWASYPEPNEEITFTAHFTTYHGFRTSFDWDFGDGSYASGLSVTHSYSQDGLYNVTLTVTTKNLVTGEEKTYTVTRSVYVHSKHVISSLPSELDATSLLTGEDLTQVPKNTYQPALITKIASEETAIAELGVHFEEATEDIDLSTLVADVDLEDAKSVIYMPSRPEEIEDYKTLFIPSTGAGTVYICLDVTSLGEVSLENADLIINVGETKDNTTVTTTFYNGREYYLVFGVTGTGGGELKDTIPPTTLLTIGEPKYVTEITYVTPDTPFNLTATDNPGGTGVALTAYKIRNATYDSGWLTYTEPFLLTGLVDGVYSIDYNSTDNANNVEPTNTINVTLFCWNYVFTDSYGRDTTIKINTEHKFFQFITPDNDYGIREATYMRVRRRTITIWHKDDELRLITLANTKIDFCVAIAWDVETRTRYLLIDKPGIE